MRIGVVNIAKKDFTDTLIEKYAECVLAMAANGSGVAVSGDPNR